MTEDLRPALRTAVDGPDDLPEPAERGRLQIADRAVERIATLAAGEVVGTTSTGASGLRAVVASGLPNAEVRVAGGRSRLRVTVATSWPSPADQVAEQVRDRVLSTVTALTGMDVDRVDVNVGDVKHVPAPRRRLR